MKKDIILSGVGGQGILSIATVIGKAALKDGLYMISFFMAYLLLFLRANVCIHSLRGMITDTPL